MSEKTQKLSQRPRTTLKFGQPVRPSQDPRPQLTTTPVLIDADTHAHTCGDCGLICSVISRSGDETHLNHRDGAFCLSCAKERQFDKATQAKVSARDLRR